MELQGEPSVMRITLEIKRAATGKTETVELIGTPLPEPKEEHVSDSQHDGSQRSD